MTTSRDEKRFRDEEELSTQRRATLLGVGYLDTRGIVDTLPMITDIITLDQMRDMYVIPLRQGNERESAAFAITSSTPQSFLKQIKDRYSNIMIRVDLYIISKSGYTEIMLRYDPPVPTRYEDIRIAKEGDSETIEAVTAILDGVKSDDILTFLIDQADKLSASDIHIENQREFVRVRLRINGVLHPVARLSHQKYRVVIASIASRSNLSTVSTDAQASRLSQAASDNPDRIINMRIETVPTTYGQDVVIRLFQFDESRLTISNLGLDEDRRAIIEDIVSHPHGMVMMVGPTGSGKSSTLYSIINALNSPSVKILSLEDPVEMIIPGVSQIPVNTMDGDSFASKLRAVLRLDPDVVMIGEIRDADTARTAIQASITGHLVLTSFHASSSAAAFARMVDMIGQNPIFSNAIRVVMSQRLVRRLDDTTKKPITPDAPTLDWIKTELEGLPDSIHLPEINDQLVIYEPGWSAEHPFGYTGRTMITEQLIITENLQQFIKGDMQDISVKKIEDAAKKDGMISMLQDGLIKVLRGETTLKEINRVL